MSIRPRIVATILKKEISETLRDRRTLFVMVGLPMLLYPLLIMGLTRLMESESEATLARASSVAVWGTLRPELAKELAARPRLELRPWAGVPPAIKADLEAGRLAKPPSKPVERKGGRPRDTDIPPETE